MTPTTGTKTERVNNTVFDLDSFDDVLLFKNVAFEPVTTTQEALARVGNDTAKFMEIVNEGLRQHVRESAKNDNSTPWLQEDEDGDVSEFTGTIASGKDVNTLKLTLAKTLFGYGKAKDADAKRASKAKAMDFIKSNDEIRESLKQNVNV